MPSVIRFLSALFCLTTLSALGGESYSFTNREGKSISAELVCATVTSATVRLTNGKEVDIPLANLSDADQAFIKDWIADHTVGDETKVLSTESHDFRDPATGKTFSATLTSILEDDDLRQFAVLRQADGTQRALKVKALTSADQAYVLKHMAKGADDAISALTKDPKTKNIAEQLKALQKALEKIKGK
jgi:hypothetical protein